MKGCYQSFDPAAQVNGDTLLTLESALLTPSKAHQLLHKHGLPTKPEAGHWYALQGWLNLLGAVEQEYGAATVYAIGLQVVAHCSWPLGLANLTQALLALDEACRTNVQGEPIGYYRTEECGLQNLRVECLTPTPPDFERGLLTGLARLYKPVGAVRVFVNQETSPADAPAQFKRFRVRW